MTGLLHRNACINRLRLGLTLGLGVLAIRIIAGLGAQVLALYLLALCVRWLSPVPGSVAETAMIPLLSRGDRVIVIEWRLVGALFGSWLGCCQRIGLAGLAPRQHCKPDQHPLHKGVLWRSIGGPQL